MADTLTMEFPAQPASVPHARHALAGWLDSVCRAQVLCDTGYDLTLALSEAVTNCVDHAYRDRPAGVISVVAELRFRSREPDPSPRVCAGSLVHLEIADRGRWRQPPEDLGYRGRGLPMIEALVDRFELAHRGPGTLVTLQKALGRC